MNTRLSRIEPLEPRALMAAGDFDTAFGNAGGFSDFTPQLIDPVLARQTDGKVLVGGRLTGAILPGGGDAVFSRYYDNGAVDTSFGKAGFARVDVRGRNDQIIALAAGYDGKIVALLTSFESSETPPSLVRLNANGTLDTTFSGDGKLQLYGLFSRMIVQSDGKIVVAGSAEAGSTNLARFTTTGVLDPTFDGDGSRAGQQPQRRIHRRTSASRRRKADRRALQRQRRQAHPPRRQRQARERRLLRRQSIAETGRTVGLIDLATTSGNKLVVLTGQSVSNSYTAVAYRIDSLGKLDPSFNGNGKLPLPANADPSHVAARTDGKLAFVGNRNHLHR